MFSRLSLRLRVFLFFGLIAAGVAALVAAGLWVGYARLDPEAPVSAFVMAGLIAGFPAVGLVIAVWRLFDENVARSIEVLASSLRARAHGGVSDELDAQVARYLGDLAPAASAVTVTLNETRHNVDEAISRETALLSAQSDKLKSLVSDVPVGLIVCNAAHSVVFYNTPARELLEATGRPRLNRPIFDLLREGPIRRTYDRLLASGKTEQDAELLLSTMGCAKSLWAHMRLVRDAMGMAGDMPGYVLTLRDITSELAVHRERERLLSDMTDRLRPAAAALKALLDMRAERAPGALDADIIDKAAALTEAVQSVGEATEATRRTWWPMQDVRASELIDGIRAHLGPAGPVLDAPLSNVMIRCDGVAMIDLLSRLAQAVHDDRLAEALSLTIAEAEEGSELRLSWRGQPMSASRLDTILGEPVSDDPEAMTVTEVLELHESAVWPEWDDHGNTWLTLPLASVHSAPSAPVHGAFVPERSAVFDFDLLEHTAHAAIDATPLKKLTYVVFDTETTGLNPNGGDEIVQIAAVRILNGRMVPGEVIDQFVDPERRIPPGATAVHGVTEAMVKGAPTIREAGAQFHRFCHGAVLVAHNAPFDLAFFHRHGPSFGARFDNPVLDTVLLSAVLFGSQEEHTLDALAARFGVTIPDAARHTAYGDTLATAEVFLRMIPMLEAKGLTTYGDVLAEMERNSRLMKEMRARVDA